MYVLSEETLYGTGMCSEACSRKPLGWLSHNNSVCHTRITWAHRCKTASSQTIPLNQNNKYFIRQALPHTFASWCACEHTQKIYNSTGVQKWQFFDMNISF